MKCLFCKKKTSSYAALMGSGGLCKKCAHKLLEYSERRRAKVGRKEE